MSGFPCPARLFLLGSTYTGGCGVLNGCPGCPSAKAPRAGGLGRAAAYAHAAAAQGERRKAPAVHSPAMVWKAKNHRPFGWWFSVFVSGLHPCAAFHAISIARSIVQKRPNFSGAIRGSRIPRSTSSCSPAIRRALEPPGRNNPAPAAPPRSFPFPAGPPCILPLPPR